MDPNHKFGVGLTWRSSNFAIQAKKEILRRLMRATYDPSVGATYIYLTEIPDGGAVRQLEVEPGIILDFDKDNVLLGIEMLDEKRVPRSVILGAKWLDGTDGPVPK